MKFGLSCDWSGVKSGLSCDIFEIKFGLSCDRSGVKFGYKVAFQGEVPGTPQSKEQGSLLVCSGQNTWPLWS